MYKYTAEKSIAFRKKMRLLSRIFVCWYSHLYTATINFIMLNIKIVSKIMLFMNNVIIVEIINTY